MTLVLGARLGPYEIQSPLGAGGMGEVYKARDTRLERTVAIKVLPDHFATDPQFRERFDREARAVAALNHPHICTLHDIGRQDGVDFLVMEYLDGETLADRLSKGALSLDQALKFAIEIADALDKAHRQGITHRDLKPGNIMLTKAGAKLLDFGLAKTGTPVVASAGLSMLPTTPPNLTAQGTILGTFQYMAPEQLEGQEADARTDIFAFGAVVYEMVTGQKAFEGKSQASLIAAILERDPPPMSSLQPLAPALLDRVVKKCLAKEPDRRWQSASDLTDELKWVAEAPSQTGVAAPVTRTTRREQMMWVAACVVAAALAGLAVWLLRPSPAATSPVARVLVDVAPADQLLGVNPQERNRSPRRPSRTAMALSPDGQRLVFSAIRGDKQQLYARALDQLDATPMAGTEDSDSPFFSPDGEWVGFWAGGELKKVPVSGGPTVAICKTSEVTGASWGSNDTIVFARPGREGLWQVSAAGATPQVLTTLDLKNGEVSHTLPQILPGNKAVVFTVVRSPTDRWTNAQIVVRSLATGEQRTLIEGGADARYVPSGHLVYARLGTLMAAPFDVAHLKLTGGAVGIVDGLMQAVNTPNGNIETGAAQFSVSGAGALVYMPGGVFPNPERSLTWVNRTGAVQTLPVPPGAYFLPRLSPDGQRLALFTQGDRNVWTYDLSRGTLTRLTTDGQNAGPVWTPDGKRLVYESTTTGAANLFWKAADGSGAAERLTTSEYYQRAASWSPDGKTLAFVQLEPTTRGDIWTLSLADRSRTPRAFLRTAAGEGWPDFSPDGRWLAYASDESGRYEVYVQPYPGPGERHQISVQGGTQPAWARNGRELFFTVPDPNATSGKLMAVDVAATPIFTAGVPRALESVASINFPVRGYDVSPDGRRFVTTQERERSSEPPPAQMILVLNWFEELKRRVPVAK